MGFDKLFWLAFQSSFLLGLVHGVSPCGHSWVVLAPFAVSTQEGKKVAWLTAAFLVGVALACLLLGSALGAVSRLIPASFSWWLEAAVSLVLILLGLALLIKPRLLRHHDEEHGAHEHGPGSCCCAQGKECGLAPVGRRRLTGTALFTIGFVNMIIPCPTVAIMYSYALDSASSLKAGLVFSVYAMGTALAVGGMIFAIHKVTTFLKMLCQDWIEPAVVRAAGMMTLFFGLYAVWHQFFL